MTHLGSLGGTSPDPENQMGAGTSPDPENHSGAQQAYEQAVYTHSALKGI